jgi:uncharacterized membrane protein
VLAGWLVPPTWWNQSKRVRGGESPEEIVKRRYAEGEIDRETYERMVGDLHAHDAEQHAAHG